MEKKMEEVIVRYLHFIGIILLSSTVILENILLKSPLKIGVITKLEKIDGAYAAGAFLTFGSGLFLWLVVGKPKEFYSNNLFFQLKTSMFLLMIVLSLFPTFFILKNSKNTISAIVIPTHVQYIIRVELFLLCILPLLAALTAKGLGQP
jgi:putative membrane protein